MEYIRKVYGRIESSKRACLNDEQRALLSAFSEELDRLDPRDFLPAYREPFVIGRMHFRLLTNESVHIDKDRRTVIDKYGPEVMSALEHYAGEGSRAETRDFPFVSDIGLRTIIERDYRELSLKLVPSGAWKSSVVMAGSILEAILYDLLTANPARKNAAMACKSAPKNKAKMTIDIETEGWKLHDLITVSEKMHLIDSSRSRTFDQILRDYRNFVHPKREIRAGHPCAEAEALMAKGALDAVCNDLQSRFEKEVL